ncbi:MAG: retroviral-like aspartic protease family protein [Chloroflexi bacterium]|nr:retroviral-like aspartic protease family protein [Chloroflexota bacterium]
MPILHVQITGQNKAPDGSLVPVDSSVAFIQRGPVVQASVSVAQQIAQPLLQQGISLPAPISGMALIDTGATTTCIDEEAARQLKLPVVNVATMASASHSATQHNVYPIQIGISGLPITINAPGAIGAPLAAQGLLLLIGRDVLQHCTLFYNGLTGEFTLSI